MNQPPRVYRPLDSREQALMERLVRECAPRVMAYVRKLFGRAFDPEDVAAETFARAAANIGSLVNCDRPDIYLLTIARNLCRDQLRRKTPESISDERFDEQPNRDALPADVVVQGELHEALRAAIADLPEPFREIVVLRLTGGLSFEEISEMLGVPLGTALSRMHNAVQRLREALASERSVQD